MYDQGVAVAGTTAVAGRMAEAHGMWGRKHLGDVAGLDDIVKVTEELVDGLEGSGIPLFVGWRNAPRDDDPAGRAAQLMQILREWRGGIHLVATTAAGLCLCSNPHGPTAIRVIFAHELFGIFRRRF